MRERILFLTGRLAEKRLEKVLQGMEPTAFDWSVFSVGVKVAALMTEPILMRRLPRPINADRVVVPGRCRADLTRLAQEFGVSFQRGPDELRDLPMFLGRTGAALDLSRHSLRIFAEIVDASQMSLEALLARAGALRAEGADVIDLGCLPDTPFPHLEEAVRELKSRGLVVSIDSADPDELRRGGLAGADYLLSLTERNLAIAEETGARPVLIPAQHGDLASLYRAAEDAQKRGLAAILDPVIDPIHFGFADSLARYREVRARFPEAELLMGTGNLTELTDADSVGVTALLLGICSELAIANVLTVHVSSHTRRTIQEHDAARRIMYAAAADHSLPRGYGRALLQVHDRKPFPYTSGEIAESSMQVKDDNYRIEAGEDGIHVYNRAGHFVAREAFTLFDKLGVETDGAHAFYLGAELTKAEIAFQLGKRYAQDEPLDWGCAADPCVEDRTRLREAGHTLRSRAASE
jgi:dihydropteroate synthase-like protein